MSESLKDEISGEHKDSVSHMSHPDIVEQTRNPDQPSADHQKSTANYVEDVGAELEVWTTDENGKKIKKKLDGVLHKDGRREIRERNCYDKLGFSFPWWKKWTILLAVFMVQVSMNFNAGFYPGALSIVSKHFKVSLPKTRVSQMLMMVCYAFGCELWAPWSEEFGRYWVMQVSLFFVNIWQILGALAPNYGSVCVARALTGLSSAGGSVTLAVVADMWEAHDQGFGVLFVVFSSVVGSVIAPIFAPIATVHLSWRWNFWIQLIVGGFAQLVHLLLARETRNSILMDREAKRRRESGEDTNIWGPGEIHKKKLTFNEMLIIWRRPFEMFLREPIVLCLSLLSGFSDALIFMFMNSLGDILGNNFGFTTETSGAFYVVVLIGYLIAYALHYLDTWRQISVMKRLGDSARFAERRLLLLLFLAPLEPIGLFGFAWTSFGNQGSHNIPWIAPALFFACIGIANFSIYEATIDYMIAAYGPYSASATGGNGFARDLLAGISVMYANPLYDNIDPVPGHPGEGLNYEYASTILGCIAVLVVIPIYLFYWKGPYIRKKSRFAQSLAADKQLELMPNKDYEDTASTIERRASESDRSHSEGIAV